MASEDVGEGRGRSRPPWNPVAWWRDVASDRWPRVLRVAVAAAVTATVVAATLSSGRDDEFLRGDLASLGFGLLATVMLAAGLDERVPPAARTIAHWVAVLGVGYVLAAVWVIVAALVAPPG